ncbi:hypothetical protein BGZ79_004172, partial [Entomortierella chlamydospora]
KPQNKPKKPDSKHREHYQKPSKIGCDATIYVHNYRSSAMHLDDNWANLDRR